MQSITRSPRRRGLLVAVVIMQMVAMLGVRSVGTAAQNAAVDRPEAIAIEDITYLGCEIETVEYASFDIAAGVYEDPISQYTEACPPGTVLHKFPTSVANAESLGIQYVRLTGDDAIDRAAVEALRQSLLPAAPEATTRENAKRALPALACSAVAKSKAVFYWAGSTGAGVAARGYYSRTSDCTWYLTQSHDYLFHNLSPGQDIYWDQVYYPNGQWWSWDAGCQSMTQGHSYDVYYGYAWWINIGDLYSDETINDPSFGCDWWGEEYVGSVYLTA